MLRVSLLYLHTVVRNDMKDHTPTMEKSLDGADAPGRADFEMVKDPEPDSEASVRDVARVFFGAVVRKNSIQHHVASDIYCVARQEPVSIGRDSRRGASTTADTLEQLRFMRSRSSAEFSRGRHLLLRGGQLAKLSEETQSLNPSV
jgi:hypothetical protein